MYRQIFIPNEQNNYIPFTIPHEWYGQLIEVIVFPISTTNISQKNTDEDFFKLCGAWESEQSAEEMISELKSARSFRERNLSL
ncbi:MAG: hypothetical protein FWF53_00275 [Candidatus Azobacteroides sp.]|nr:hypothetical protein [Candidatus Azobacteroides sp.]